MDNTDTIEQQSINSSYTKDDLITQDDPKFHYFHEVNHKRADVAFETFKNRTDEKEQTEKILKQFLGEYLSSYINDCKVLDFGLGEGDLATKKANIMKKNCRELLYAGIDQSKDFVNITRSKLTSNKVDNQIVVGDMFKEDNLNQLPHKATTVLASQVAYYAPSIINFTDSVISRFEKAAFIIVQTNTSFLHNITKKYSIGIQKVDIVEEINEALLKHREVIFKNVPYPASIDFPKIDLDSLHSIAREPYNEIYDSDKKIARDILEFIAGNSMECLEYLGLLEEYIDEVIKHLKTNNGQIIFWNNLALIVQTKDMPSERLQEFWQKLQEIKYINDYNPFEQAISEGKISVAKFLIEQGLIITEKKEEGLLKKTLLTPFRIFDYSKQQSYKEQGNEGIYEKQFSLVKLAVDKNDTKTLTYLVNDIAAVTNIKNHIYAHEGFNFFILLNYAPMALLGSIMGIINNFFFRFDNDMFRFITGEFLAYSTSVYHLTRYYGTGTSNLHSAIINNNVASAILIYIDSEGKGSSLVTLQYKNTLHLSVDNNNKELVEFFVTSRANEMDQYDYYGYTELHYAIKNNNFEIFRFLIEHGSDINIKVKSHFADIAIITLGFCYQFGITEVLKLYDLDQYTALLVTNFGLPVYLGNIAIPSILILLSNFIPFSYTTSSLMLARNLTNPFYQNTGETSLHLAIKYNATEIIEYLVYNQKSITEGNIYGETALHYACAKGDLNIVKILLNKDVDINAFAKHELSSYEHLLLFHPHTHFVISSLNPFAGNLLLRFVSLFLYFKTKYSDRIFENFVSEEFGTPLHYALHHGDNKQIFREYKKFSTKPKSFSKESNNIPDKSYDKLFYWLHDWINFKVFLFNSPEACDVRSKIYTKNNNYFLENELEVVKYLVESGANPDIGLSAYLFLENFYLLGSSWLFIYYSAHFSITVNPSTNYRCNILIKSLMTAGSIIAFPFKAKYAKPIDYFLGKEDTEAYKLLKQYTTMNQYTSTDEISRYNPTKLLYYIGTFSDVDVIEMKNYGMYKGGTGKDTFIIHKNYTGKDEGYKIIIKDYEAGEQIILDQSFGIVNTKDIQYEFRKVMNKSSIALLTKDGEEIVTLLNYDYNDIKPINIKSIFLSNESHNISWWSYFFGNKKIEINDLNQIYSSKHDSVSFLIDESVYDIDQNAAFVIKDFDCINNKQVINFSKLQTIQKIEDITLEEIENTSVLVKDYSTEKVLLILSGIDLYDLSAKCFVFE